MNAREDLRRLLVEYAGISRREGLCALKGLPDQPELIKAILNCICPDDPNSGKVHDGMAVKCILKALYLMLDGKRADEIERELAFPFLSGMVTGGHVDQETFTYKTTPDVDIHLDVYTPQGLSKDAGTLIWIHGGALIGGSRGPDRTKQFGRYFDAGYRVVSIDYRLAPETKLPEIISDVRDAFEWVRSRGWERIGVVGHSAGGYLSLMSGTFSHPPRAIVSFYGYGDIVGDWYAKPDPFYCQKPKVNKEEAYAYYCGPPVTSPEQREVTGPFYLYCRQNGLWPIEVAGCDPATDPAFFVPYCPERNVTDAYPPTILLHGDQDTDVPYVLSVQMSQALSAAGVAHELITIQGGGHGFEGGPGESDLQVQRAWDRAMGFLAEHM